MSLPPIPLLARSPALAPATGGRAGGDRGTGAYHLRMAWPRRRGGVDTGHIRIVAGSAKEAVDRAARLVTAGDADQAGIAILVDAAGLMLWSHRAPTAQPAPAVEHPHASVTERAAA